MAAAVKISVHHNALKFLFVLLVWTIILVFVLRIYNNDANNPYYDRNNEIKRKTKFTNLLSGRQILENYSEKPKIQELPLFDNSTGILEQEEIIAAIEAEHSSIAFRYWRKHMGKKLQKSKNCAKFPSLHKLQYHNKYWQTFVKENITIQLYNAYYDARPKEAPVIRLLAMSNETSFANRTIYCQLWYDDALQPSITKANDFSSIWNLKWGKREQFFPFLITCPLPSPPPSPTNSTTPPSIPKVVSLVAAECDTATNTLRIHYEVPTGNSTIKQKFAICVKGLDYPYMDISARLVEWIELQLLLGASKIFFYQLQIHPNVTKVLDYYRKRDLIDIRPITLAGGEPSLSNLQHYLLGAQRGKKRMNELIPYNDCFYRNLYRYDYLAIQDIDEVIMPLGNLTKWSELIDAVRKPAKCFSSYCLRNVYFSHSVNTTEAEYASDDLPHFMHMLQHVERNVTHQRAGFNAKCFHRTDLVVTLHNHLPRSYLKYCPAKYFDASIAQLQHYRERPPLKDTVVDASIWRYKDELLQRSLDALRDMGFLRIADEYT